MSRTHAHRPYWAWFSLPSSTLGDLLYAHHDHADGTCDLPDVPAAPLVRRAGICFWELDLARLPSLCGCPMCTDQDGRRQDRRQNRHHSRAALRGLAGLSVADAVEQADDLALPPR